MLRIGFLDSYCEIDIQRQLLKEGNAISVWFDNNPAFNKGDAYGVRTLGMSPSRLKGVCGNLEGVVKGCDMTAVYGPISVKQKEELHKYRAKHKTPIVGLFPKEITDLEDDRFYGQQVAEANLSVERKIVLPFFTEDQVLEYLSSATTPRLVMKVHRKRVAEKNGYFYPGTTVDMSPEQLAYFIKMNQKILFEKGNYLTIEPFLVGYEVNIGGWFNGKSWVDNTVLLDQEYKGAVNGDQGGVLTNQIGTACTLHNPENLPPRLYAVATNLSNFLAKYDYRGYCAINLMIENKRVHFLEWTCRVGIPSEYEVSFYVNSYTNLLTDMAGLTKNAAKFKRGPVYLFSCLNNYGSDENTVVPVAFDTEVIKHREPRNGYRLLGARITKDGTILNSREGRVLTVCGTGNTLKAAQADLKKDMACFTSYNCYFRTDIGYKWKPINSLWRTI